jgi:ABC-type antimicrobial peptide transport system permease subunit
VTPAYHRTLGIPLRRGRLFDATDGSRNVVLISESTARQFFGADDPIGQTVTVAGAERIVVGVVGDARQGNLEAVPMPETYLPLSQGGAASGYLAIRTDGDPYRLLPVVRSAVLAALPNVPLRDVATLDDLVRGQTAQRRLTMLMLSLLGGIGLVISAVGVYGLMAYAVVQRTHEIGVRMALGATRGTVTRMVYAQASRLIVLGVTIGAAAAWYLSGTVQSFLYGSSAFDVRALVVAVAALSLAALGACVVPARRAATVDPVVSLRDE